MDSFTRKHPFLTCIAPTVILVGMNLAERIEVNLWWLPSKERAVR